MSHRGPLLVPAMVILVGAVALSVLFKRKPPPNEPPVVPYSLPWIGHYLALAKDPRKFIADANAKYGEIYTIVLFGRKYTVVSGQSLSNETFKTDEKVLNFIEAAKEFFPVEDIFEASYGHKFVAGSEVQTVIIEFVRNHLKTRQLTELQSEVMEGTKVALDRELGLNGAVWDTPWSTMERVLASIVCFCFASPDIGRDEELIKVMAELTKTALPAGIVHGHLPAGLNKLVVRHFFSIEKEMDFIFDKAKPVLDNRVLKRQQDPDWVPPKDYLQRLQDMQRLHSTDVDDQERQTGITIIALLHIAFAAIHTTSMHLTFALNHLAADPEIVARLRVEIAEATAKSGGTLIPTATNDMPMLDSFLREVLRVNVDHLGYGHLAMYDHTFANGMVVPKGRVVLHALDSMHNNPEIQSAMANEDLHKFDAFRFVGSTKKSPNASSSFKTFGGGPHTCPGRFFATLEIKYILASILQRYDIRTTANGRAPNQVLMGMIVLPPKNAIIFEPVKPTPA